MALGVIFNTVPTVAVDGTLESNAVWPGYGLTLFVLPFAIRSEIILYDVNGTLKSSKQRVLFMRELTL